MANQEVKNRAAAAIVGGIVADASVNPLHWIYDRDVLDKYLHEIEVPEFFSKWGTIYYKLPVGSFSCYGDQAYCLLDSIVQNKGFQLEEYCKSIYKWFGPESAYKEPNPSKDFPKQGPWRNGNITRSLDNLHAGKLQDGSDEAESDSFSKIIPLVALLAGDESLKKNIEQVVRTTLNNDKSVRTAIAYGSLLEATILSGELNVEKWLENLPENDVKEEIKAVIQARDEPHIEKAKHFGIRCHLPESFQNSIHCLLQGESYVESVRLALTAGGGNCARAMAVGALLAASAGKDQVPNDWISKTIHGKEVVDMAEKLVAMKRN